MRPGVVTLSRACRRSCRIESLDRSRARRLVVRRAAFKPRACAVASCHAPVRLAAPRDTCTPHGAAPAAASYEPRCPPSPLYRPLSPARRLADLAHSQLAARRPRGRPRWRRSALLLARRVDLAVARRLRHRVGLDRRLAAAQPGLGRGQGDRLEGGARRAARSAPRALRARRAGALHRLPAQHGALRAHRRARARRGARRGAGGWPARASRRARSPARRSPSSSCSASRSRSRSSRSRPCCTCRTWSGSS